MQEARAAALSDQHQVYGALPRPRLFRLGSAVVDRDALEGVGHQLAGLGPRVIVQRFYAVLQFGPRHGPGGPFRWCSSYEQGRAGAELWLARHEDRLREDVAKILAWQEKVRGNRLAKAHQDPPFGWMG